MKPGKSYLTQQRDFANVTNDLEMGRVSCIIRWVYCNHKRPDKREVGVSVRGESVMVEGEVRVRPLLKGLLEPRNEQPLEDGESKRWSSS